MLILLLGFSASMAAGGTSEDLASHVPSGMQLLHGEIIDDNHGDDCVLSYKNVDRGIEKAVSFLKNLHYLSFVESDPEIGEMKEKTGAFLLSNKVEPGVWRFYEKNDSIPPDLEDTAIAYASLIENEIPIEERFRIFSQIQDY